MPEVESGFRANRLLLHADLDDIPDADERKATTSTIHNFGMTPKQLFAKPHPARLKPLVAKGTRPIFSHDLHIEHQAQVLVESILPVLEISGQISAITASTPDKTHAIPVQTLGIPNHNDLFLSWGYPDRSVRVHTRGQALPSLLFEQLHSEHVSAVCFADTKMLVTGSTE